MSSAYFGAHVREEDAVKIRLDILHAFGLVRPDNVAPEETVLADVSRR